MLGSSGVPGAGPVGGGTGGMDMGGVDTGEAATAASRASLAALAVGWLATHWATYPGELPRQGVVTLPATSHRMVCDQLSAPLKPTGVSQEARSCCSDTVLCTSSGKNGLSLEP